MSKESITKSGQATSEQYISKWMIYDQLQFLRTGLSSAKSRDSTGTTQSDLECLFLFWRMNHPQRKQPLKSL